MDARIEFTTDASPGLVTIVIPARNRDALIGATLESIRLQTYTHWGPYEIEVADDRIVLMVLVVVTALAGMGYLQVFAPRAAFLHVGALLGTIMALNVVFVIIPGHIAMRRQVQSGERLDITLGAAAKRRSQHNNYFTLPVIFSMVGVHFAAGYGHAWAWIILPLAMVSGVA